VEEIPDWEKLYVVADGKYTDVIVHNLSDALTGVVNAGESYVPCAELDDAARKSVNRFYFYNKDTEKYDLAYVMDDAGLYYPKTPKGNPGGLSCKTIVSNFIRADMKPSAITMEGRVWAACFHDSDESRKNREDLKRGVRWLHAHGMRALLYFRVGGTDVNFIGFKPEYRVHADVTYTNSDGTVEYYENTTAIPWILGTGDKADVGWRNGKRRELDHLDITSDEAVEWYFDRLWGELMEIGIDGAKIDFCEVIPDGDRQIGSSYTHFHWKNPDRLPTGGEHHAYSTYFASLFCKKMAQKRVALGIQDGPMVFVRGGGIGLHRNPYTWAGDQSRTYEKLDDQLLAVVNAGISGLPFMTFDMGGYSYSGGNYFTIAREKESALFARATEFTAFLTQFQTNGDVRHAYEMTDEVQQIYRNFTGLHRELLPYIQRYSRIACDTGMPPVRHPVLKYPGDRNVYDIIDEFMLGDAILVAPILTENTFERDVYLPAGSWTNLLTDEVIEGGKTVTVAASLGQIPVFLDNNSPDARELMPVFKGLWWNAIKNFK
jgi:hypothetical protein